MAHINLAGLGADCSSGVCLDTSGVPVAPAPPISSISLSPPQLQDLMDLPQNDGSLFPFTPAIDPNAGCYPVGFVGPLPPGGTYCPVGAGGVPVTTMPWGVLAAVLGGIVLFSFVGGGRHR